MINNDSSLAAWCAAVCLALIYFLDFLEWMMSDALMIFLFVPLLPSFLCFIFLWLLYSESWLADFIRESFVVFWSCVSWIMFFEE